MVALAAAALVGLLVGSTLPSRVHAPNLLRQGSVSNDEMADVWYPASPCPRRASREFARDRSRFGRVGGSGSLEDSAESLVDRLRAIDQSGTLRE